MLKKAFFTHSLLFLLISVPTVLFSQDYKSKIQKAVIGFNNNIFDREQCLKYSKDCEKIAAEIQGKMGSMSGDVAAQHQEFYKDADAISRFMYEFGDVDGESKATLEDFHVAKKYISYVITPVIKGKYCVDFYKIQLGDYVAYVADNTDASEHRVSYNWRTDNYNKGDNTIKVGGNNIQTIYTNRLNKMKKDYNVYLVKCDQ